MDADRDAADREERGGDQGDGAPAAVAQPDHHRDGEGAGGVVAGKAGVGGVAGEKVDAVRLLHERPRPVDQFRDHLADRQREDGAQAGCDRGPPPPPQSLAVGEDEDPDQGGDEERLADVDVEEQRVLDRVVAVEEVVEGVEDAPFHRVSVLLRGSDVKKLSNGDESRMRPPEIRRRRPRC